MVKDIERRRAQTRQELLAAAIEAARTYNNQKDSKYLQLSKRLFDKYRKIPLPNIDV